jgi:hypothetical protein
MPNRFGTLAAIIQSVKASRYKIAHTATKLPHLDANMHDYHVLLLSRGGTFA